MTIVTTFIEAEGRDVHKIEALRREVRSASPFAHEFVLLTDADVEHDETRRVMLAHGWPPQYALMELFRPLISPGGNDRLLYIDPDFSVVGMIDEIVAAEEPFIVGPDHDIRLMMWTRQAQAHSYEEFARIGKRAMDVAVSARDWIWRHAGRAHHWDDVVPGQVSFDGTTGEDTRLVIS